MLARIVRNVVSMTRRRRHYLIGALSLGLTCSLTGHNMAFALGAGGGASAAGESTPGGEWEGYNKTLDGQRYSPLTQINAGNAGSLSEVCRLQVSEQGSFQAGLVIIGQTMFATTATDTLALDPATCKTKWLHVYKRSAAFRLPINRGVAYLNGRVFRGTDDGRVIALDAKTGDEIWTDVVGDPRIGEWLPAAPIAWNGLVIIGTAAGDFGVRGRVVALDALTGREVWRFNTVPVGDEAQSNTWKNTRWNEHGGGGSWSSYTIDVTTGEVFIPVGNPVPDFTPADRPGTNLFTNSVVVLDAVTGRLKWWYQLKTNDSADHDLAAAPLLYRDKNGQERVAAAGKDGYLHIIDRASHSLVVKTAVTTVDAVPAPASTTGVKVCPGAAGGVEWNGPAYDPEHQLLFVGAVDLCSMIRSSPGSKYTPGGLNYGGSWSFTSDRPSGWITAVDSTTGAVAWKYHASAPVLSGITSTAGNIVFGGDNSGHFVVFESTTGKLLKDISTGGSLSGGVVTYEISGKQYVAFTSGNISRTVFGAAGRPTIIVMAVPSSEGTQATARKDDPGRGQQLFYGLCAGCHGSDGKNIDGYDLSTVKTRMNFAQIIEWIKHPAPPMPKVFPDPPNVSEEQDLRDMATFLHETIK